MKAWRFATAAAASSSVRNYLIAVVNAIARNGACCIDRRVSLTAACAAQCCRSRLINVHPASRRKC